MKNIFLLFTYLLFPFLVIAQDQVLPLYPEGIPCENDLNLVIVDRGETGRGFSQVHTPELVAYFPKTAEANGTSVVICPGGGYRNLAWDKEGTKIAEWFNGFGITTFVLKYRLPAWESDDCKEIVALQDAQRAMRTIRSNAKEWNLDTDRVGIMGFSAGGHLAATLSTHFDYGKENAALDIDKYSCRPDFSILMYPVISMEEAITHKGSQINLLGQTPKKEKANYYSNEAQVTAESPPAILFHANDDKSVVPENSIQYYLGLRQHKIPAAMHIFEKGGHGFGMAAGKGITAEWPTLCKGWMEDRGLLVKRIKVN